MELKLVWGTPVVINLRIANNRIISPDKTKGWKIHWLTRGCLALIPPYCLRIPRKFLSEEFSCDLQSSYRVRKSTFSSKIFAKVFLVVLATWRTSRYRHYYLIVISFALQPVDKQNRVHVPLVLSFSFYSFFLVKKVVLREKKGTNWCSWRGLNSRLPVQSLPPTFSN